MRTYTIRIGQRGRPRLAFEALAENAFGALIDHEEKRQAGERIEVEPISTDAQALDDQVRHQMKAL